MHPTFMKSASFTMLTDESFGKILDLKITHLKKNFNSVFCLISAIKIQAWD
jgi:hypothetical protein